MATPYQPWVSSDTFKDTQIQTSIVVLSTPADVDKDYLGKIKLQSQTASSRLCGGVQESRLEQPKQYAWRPSFFRIRPMVGLAAILVAIICMFVSLSVLVTSDGKTSASWSLQPTVYLAVATALSNTALNSALVQAAPISWWYVVLLIDPVGVTEFRDPGVKCREEVRYGIWSYSGRLDSHFHEPSSVA